MNEVMLGIPRNEDADKNRHVGSERVDYERVHACIVLARGMRPEKKF